MSTTDPGYEWVSDWAYASKLENTPKTSLLADIMNLGEEVFVAWEKFCSVFEPSDFRWFCEVPIGYNGGLFLTKLDQKVIGTARVFDAVYWCGRYIAAYVPGPNVWIPRLKRDGESGAPRLHRRAQRIYDYYSNKSIRPNYGDGR